MKLTQIPDWIFLPNLTLYLPPHSPSSLQVRKREMMTYLKKRKGLITEHGEYIKDTIYLYLNFPTVKSLFCK